MIDTLEAEQPHQLLCLDDDEDREYWNVDRATPMDVSNTETRVLLVGEGGAHITISQSAHTLLRLVYSGEDFSAIASTVSEVTGKIVSVETVRLRYRNLAAQLAAIRQGTVEAARKQLPWGFWLSFQVLPESAVQKIARFLEPAFHPWTALCLVLTAVILCFRGGPAGIGAASNGGHLATIFLAYLALLLVHEFGHATACSRFGQKPRTIGFVMYLVYPALYSDVSAAWRLKRWQRFVVDIAGGYFQIVFSAALLLLYSKTHWESLRTAVHLGFYSLLFSLNPVFKFDGYWAVADALGVTNLGHQPKRILVHAIHVFQRKDVRPLPWPPFIVAFLALYAVATVAVWTKFLSGLFPAYFAQLRVLFHHAESLLALLRNGEVPPLTSWSHGAFSVLFIVFFSGMIWSLFNVLLQAAAACARRVKGWRVTRGLAGSW